MKKHEVPDPADERLDAVLSELKRLVSRTDFLTELSLDERCALPKLDEDRELFAHQALELGKFHPELLPPHVDVRRLQKGLEFRRKAMELFEMSNHLTERLDDSIVISGSEAYVAALSVYQALSQRVEDEPSLREDYEQLQRLFEPWEHVVR